MAYGLGTSGLMGTCSLVIHLLIKYPILVAVLGLTGAGVFVNDFVTKYTQPTAAVIETDSTFRAEVDKLSAEGKSYNYPTIPASPELTAAMTNTILENLLCCNTMPTQVIMASPQLREEISHLYYLNSKKEE
ncbi:MAG: hypothetical protein AB1552_02005 [Nitrospirota bacterium]